MPPALRNACTSASTRLSLILARTRSISATPRTAAKTDYPERIIATGVATIRSG
jgi:hypothetical protein